MGRIKQKVEKSHRILTNALIDNGLFLFSASQKSGLLGGLQLGSSKMPKPLARQWLAQNPMGL
jgi:hypothetical protein